MNKIVPIFLAAILVFQCLPVFGIEPLQRAPASSPRLVNSFGTPLTGTINVNQQVQITSDIQNNQDTDQKFVYIVQIKNQDDVVISISWFVASLSPNQKLSPAISWTPRIPGEYTAEIFVWESLNNKDPLSSQIILPILVS